MVSYFTQILNVTYYQISIIHLPKWVKKVRLHFFMISYILMDVYICNNFSKITTKQLQLHYIYSCLHSSSTYCSVILSYFKELSSYFKVISGVVFELVICSYKCHFVCFYLKPVLSTDHNQI